MWPFKKKKKTFDEYMEETMDIEVHGVPFTIRRVNVYHFLEGYNCVRQVFETYEQKRAKVPEVKWKQAEQYYRDLFCAGIVSPKLKRKESDEGELLVDNLLTDSTLITALHEAIYAFTYGKKKVISTLSNVRVC